MVARYSLPYERINPELAISASNFLYLRCLYIYSLGAF